MSAHRLGKRRRPLRRAAVIAGAISLMCAAGASACTYGAATATPRYHIYCDFDPVRECVPRPELWWLMGYNGIAMGVAMFILLFPALAFAFWKELKRTPGPMD